MAKVSYTKLKLKTKEDIKTLQLNDDVNIEIKQYLPIQEKLRLIGRVIELAHEQDYNCANPVKIDVYSKLEIVFAYTNLSFTEKQSESADKLYDQLYSNGILDFILNNIPKEELDCIFIGVTDSMEAIYQYQNSAYGILEGLQKGYNEETLDVEALKAELTELKDSPLLKEIIPLLNIE